MTTDINRQMEIYRNEAISKAIHKFKENGINPAVLAESGLKCTVQDIVHNYQTNEFEFTAQHFVLQPNIPSLSTQSIPPILVNKESVPLVAGLQSHKRRSHTHSHTLPDYISGVSRDRDLKRHRKNNTNTSTNYESDEMECDTVQTDESNKSQFQSVENMVQSSESDSETAKSKKNKQKTHKHGHRSKRNHKHKSRSKHSKKKSKKRGRKRKHYGSDDSIESENQDEGKQTPKAKKNGSAVIRGADPIEKGQQFIYGAKAGGSITMTCFKPGIKNKTAEYHCVFYYEYPIQFKNDKLTKYTNVGTHLFGHVARGDFDKYTLSVGNVMPKMLNMGFVDQCGFVVLPGIKKARLWEHILNCKKIRNDVGEIIQTAPSEGYYLFKCSTSLPSYMSTPASDETSLKGQVLKLVSEGKYKCLGRSGPPQKD
ncbi:MAG: hypothetical protein GY928_08460 [Colwellia sp.]|nr:hypothetical protein [Colwellia sp.]